MNEGICKCGHRVLGHYSSGRCAAITCKCQRITETNESHRATWTGAGEPTPETVDQVKDVEPWDAELLKEYNSAKRFRLTQESTEMARQAAVKSPPAPVEDPAKVWQVVLGDLTFDVGRVKVNCRETTDQLRQLRRYVEDAERSINDRLTALERVVGRNRTEVQNSVAIVSDSLGESMVQVRGTIRDISDNLTIINDQWPNLKQKRAKKKKRK